MPKDQWDDAALVASRTPPAAMGPHVRLLHEALGRLASPQVRDRILTSALGRAGLREIPEDAAEFGAFAAAELRETIEGTLGEDEAHAVMIDLGPAFAHDRGGLGSGVRRRQAASLRPPHAEAPVVLVASQHAVEVDAIVERVKHRAKVLAAFDVFALLAAAGRYPTRPLTVLLNDTMSGIRPSTLGTLARLVAPNSRIVVWGGADVRPEMREARAPVEWMRLGTVEEPEALADVCLAFLPAPQPEARRAPKVVVAHGDADWRARAVERLQKAGYAAVAASDGTLAFERCIADPPDAIVAGYGLDGPQLANLVRARYGDEGPTIVLVAAPPLPELPEGVVAIVREDAGDDLLAELSAWIGHGV